LRLSLRLSVAFQWFLTAFSVRPASVLAISDQRLPNLEAAARAGTQTAERGAGRCQWAAVLLQQVIWLTSQQPWAECRGLGYLRIAAGFDQTAPHPPPKSLGGITAGAVLRLTVGVR
jgi:hypothetical protein